MIVHLSIVFHLIISIPLTNRNRVKDVFCPYATARGHKRHSTRGPHTLSQSVVAMTTAQESVPMDMIALPTMTAETGLAVADV